MSNWELMQAMKVGASPQTCQMGGANFRFDARKYGSALQEEGYPLIRRWLDQDWSVQSEAECLQFLQDAINRGSIPMLAIASLALKHDEVKSSQMIQSLSDREVNRLKSLIKIGMAMDEWSGYLSGWIILSPHTHLSSVS
jgi:hypothetical protein